MPDRATFLPPSSRGVAGKDFLFHLFRGSELLQGCLALAVEPRATRVLRARALLGRIGKIGTRPLSRGQAPAQARDYLAALGEGMVLVDAR